MVFTIKQLTLLVVTLTVVVVAVNGTTFTLGRPVPGNGVVCRGDVNLRGQYGKVVSATRFCNVPRPDQQITYVVAYDIGRPGLGGYARVLNGGLNQKTITLAFQSQISQPLNFTIEVYAKPYY